MIVFKIRAIQIISGKVGHNRVGWWKNKKCKVKEKSYDGKKKQVIWVENMWIWKIRWRYQERDWAQPAKGESGGLKERKLRRGTILAALPSSNRANGGT